MYRPKPAHSLLALFILTLSMLVACFWPFNFHPRNDVVHLPGEHGLRFQGNGTAYSREPFSSLNQLSETSELTIDMTIKPKRIISSGVPNILSFCAEEGPPALVIGAWKKSLVVRLGRPGNRGWKKYREIGVGDVFAVGKIVHLVISLGPRGVTIYVDGHLRGSFPDAIPNTADASLGRLFLGNSPTGGSLWKGDIFSLSLYDRALTLAEVSQGAMRSALPENMDSNVRLIARYRFDKMQGNFITNLSSPRHDIVIPTYFSPLRRTVLEPPRGGRLLSLSFISDFVLNVLGFVPFGCLVMLLLGTATAISPRWQSTIVVLAGFSLSLGIELIQVYLPTRSSSLLDLATNTMGTAIGVLVFFILYTGKPERVDEEIAIS